MTGGTLDSAEGDGLLKLEQRPELLIPKLSTLRPSGPGTGDAGCGLSLSVSGHPGVPQH